ncbi:MAG TPA: hypothetical protein VFU49_11190, partial [Ktedonobacteraceae bacterium]|nr:hypothetical protein [Ktedonobacteraceae bacterium]
GSPDSKTLSTFFTVVLLLASVVHVGLVLIEIFGSHVNSHVATAARYMSRGGLRRIFWGLFLLIGSFVPLALLSLALLLPGAQAVLLGIAGICALIGLFAYEHCFVVAGQIVPLS